MSLSPTLEPGGQLVVVGTRYHQQDMYGQFQAGGYKDDHLLIRALEAGEKGKLKSFWPDFFSVDWLEEKRVEIGTAAFNAQYQNDPKSMSGGIFKRDWLGEKWNTVSTNVIKAPDRREKKFGDFEIYQGMDLAISQRTTADFTVHCTVGHDRGDGAVYVLELIRGRFTPMEQERLVIDQYRKWEGLQARPRVVAIEAIGYQDALPRAIASVAPYIPVRRIVPYKDKVTRANSIAVLAEQGRLIFPFDGGGDILIEELVDFPNGAFDDCVDALELCVTGSRGGGERLRRKPRGM
jgi:predicted phage terminase large subunit-like protein